MKQIFYLSLCLLACYTLWTCDEVEDIHSHVEVGELEVDFDPQYSTPCEVPCQVFFDNTSKNATRYEWTFGEEGDEDTSTETSPTYIYQIPRDYQVTLKAFGASNQEDSITKQISVVAPPCPTIARFEVQNNNCLWPCSITFDNASENATSYIWDFGDGTTATTASPVHTYEKSGEYNVTLRAIGDCEDVLTKTASVRVITFTKTFGETEFFYGYSVQQTIDGGYIILGRKGEGWDNRDMHLMKTDLNGEEVWSKTFGRMADDIGTSIQQTNDGGYILVGSIDIIHPTALDYQDIYMVKVNSSGEEMWAQNFGGTPHVLVQGTDVQQTDDGGYILAGTLVQSSSNGGNEMYLAKTDRNGEKIWSKTFGFGVSTLDVGRAVVQANDGGYVLLGYTRDSNTGDYAAYLVKTNNNGEEIWSKTFGGEDKEEAYSLAKTSDGGYIFLGHTMSSGEGSQDMYLVKINSNGNLQWEKTFGGTQSDIGFSVQQTKDEGYILLGSTWSFDNAGADDIYLLKTDKYGNELWYNAFGQSGRDSGVSVQQTQDGGYILCGVGWSNNSLSHSYLIKTDCEGNVN